MRVGSFTPPMQKMQNRQPQKPSQSTKSGTDVDTPAMLMARRIRAEQGTRQAGYFLYAAKQFISPSELRHIERTLNIKAERDPEHVANPQPQSTGDKQQNIGGNSGKNNMQMMQMLMGLMNGKSKLDPMTIMKMMNR